MDITNTTLARHGMRLGAYDGARRRRHVLFIKAVEQGEDVEWRHEFDTRREAKARARQELAARGLSA